MLAFLSSRSHGLGVLLKGNARPLVRDGHILWEEMRRNHISEGDLLEMLRLRGRLADPREVGQACLERNGEISAIPLRGEPRIVDVEIRDGVQMVRLEIG
ncbi:MAG TPA: YetF domain-containing protein [Thermoanaerobaculia bacterium]|nr:YetF domain-containing protein [Thermoanaerobaculia bacterium]